MKKVPLRQSGANSDDHFLESALTGSRHESAHTEAGVERRAVEPGGTSVLGGGDSGDGSGGSGRSGGVSDAIVQVALEGGMVSLSDADLVAILLGSNETGGAVSALASDLLESWGGLVGLSRLGPSALAGQAGVGSIKAMRLLSSFELGWRVFERAARPRERLVTPEAVAGWFGARIGVLVHEEMWVLSLDGRNGLMGARRVAQGGRHGCSVMARDILRTALVDGASAMVLVHNHPGGDPSPSSQDLEMTEAVAEAAAVVGVPLRDHVIVTSQGKYMSLRDMGVLAVV